MADVASPQDHVREMYVPVVFRPDAPVRAAIKKQDGYLNFSRGRSIVPVIFRKYNGVIAKKTIAEIVVERGNFLI